MSAIDFVRSLYTVSDGNTLNGWSSSPSNGDTATANSQTYTYSSSRNLWVLATGVTNTITDGATYSWDGEKWIAQSHIPFRYFGPQASDPTGMSADDAGDLYFNTTSDTLKFYTGSAWEDYSIPEDGTVTPAKLSTGGPYWNTSGDVGIGTSSPGTELEVVATSPTIKSRATGNNTANIALDSNRAANVIGGQILGQWNGNTVSRIDFVNGADSTNKDDGEIRFNTSASASSPTEKMRLDSDGNLGIGTSSPTAKLQITTTGTGAETVMNFGNGNIGAGLQVETTDGNLVWGFNALNSRSLAFSTNQTERMRIDSSGNLGVGTSSPSGPLHVRNNDNSPGGVIQIWDADTGANLRNAQLLAPETDSADAPFTFFTNNAWNFRVDSIDAITIDSGGEVGIGTTSPDEILHIQGNTAEFKGTNTNQISDTAGTEQVFKFGIEGQKNSVYGPAGSIIFRQAGVTWSSVNTYQKPTRIEFCTQDAGTADESETPRLVVDHNGNVGIGTSSPLAKLNVSSGDVSLTPSADADELFLENTANCGLTIGCGTNQASNIYFAEQAVGVSRGAIVYNTNSDYMAFSTAGLVNERMRIDSDGNVGIGTSSPAYPLTVTNSTAEAITAKFAQGQDQNFQLVTANGSATNSSGNEVSRFGLYYAGSTNDWNSYLSFIRGNGATSGSIAFISSQQEAIRIDSSGNVGIGTSSPSSILHTQGSRDYTGTTPGFNSYDVNFQSDSAVVSIGQSNGIPSIQGHGTGTAYNLALAPNAGKVGIGTTDIDGQFEVRSGGLGIISRSTTTQTTDSNKALKVRNNSDTDTFTVSYKGAGYFAGGVLIDADNKSEGALRIESNQTNPDNGNYYAQKILSTLSGTTATTGDRGQGGLLIDINSSATGGDTDNEHRAYGIYVDLDSTGDADHIVGVYADATATPTEGETTLIIGGDFRAEDNGGAGETSFSYGVRGTAIVDNSDADSNGMYGGYFKSVSTSDAGVMGQPHGVYSKVEINGSADIAGNTFVTRSVYDNNTGVAQTNTTYLFHGSYSGTLPTSAYGVYISSDVDNYFAGNIGVGTTSPTNKMHLRSDSTSSVDQLFLQNRNGGASSGSRIAFGNGTVDYGDNRYAYIGTENTGDSENGNELVFATNANGAAATERLRIADDGETNLFTDTVFRLRTARTSGLLRAFSVVKGATSTSAGSGDIVMDIKADGDVENDNNSYGGISDSKLKENIIDASSQWDDIKGLQVRKYNFKAETGRSTHTQIGVIAQEVETVSPGLVENTPDTDDDGNDLGTVTKSVNYSVLYMKAVKALQEAMTRIETLEAKVAALESN